MKFKPLENCRKLGMAAFARYNLNLRWNHHGPLPLLLFIALMVAPAAWSQNNRSVYLDFDKEMANSGPDSAGTAKLSTTFSIMPSWFNMQLPEEEDTLFVFGISDPGLNDTLAHHQAVFRALAFGALANVTSCEHFSDFYSQEKGFATNSKYEEIYRFSADFSAKISISTIISDTILPSSEAIVLLGIPRKNLQNDSMKNIIIEAVLYNTEADVASGKKMSKKIDVSIGKRATDEMLIIDAGSFYQINGRATGMRCSFPQSQYAYDRYEFYYVSENSTHEADSTEALGTTCKQGLWIAYVSQIMEQLSMQAKMLINDLQAVRDKTDDTSTELLRERSRTRLSWRINTIDIHDDKMWVNMTTSKFQPAENEIH